MRSREPAVAVELVMIEPKLTNELRPLGTTTLQTRSDVKNNQAIVPVSKICQSIFHLQVMQITSGYLFAFLCANHAGHRILGLPACYFFGVLGVGKIDHPHGAGCVVS